MYKIKSNYFIEKVFSLLNEGIKLKLVKYSKRLKSIIKRNLNNYKIFSGRYIINDEKGKVKEYNRYTNNLIFKGEYYNNERTGKGEEYYDNGNLRFKGEYIKGKKWNGIIYSNSLDGYISGELKNGDGLVKEYNEYGEIIFDGKYFNGVRDGRGTEYFLGEELIFEGEYLNGKK